MLLQQQGVLVPHLSLPVLSLFLSLFYVVSRTSLPPSLLPSVPLSSPPRPRSACPSSRTCHKVCAYRRPVMIGVMLMLIQAFTGINTVIFYSTTIFDLAGVHNTVRYTYSTYICTCCLFFSRFTCLLSGAVETRGCTHMS